MGFGPRRSESLQQNSIINTTDMILTTVTFINGQRAMDNLEFSGYPKISKLQNYLIAQRRPPK
jgi:hypothetical protein